MYRYITTSKVNTIVLCYVIPLWSTGCSCQEIINGRHTVDEIIADAHRRYDAADYEGAIRLYSEAIENHNNDSVYADRALAFYKLNDYHRALNDLNIAIDKYPNSPLPLTMRGRLYHELGMLDEALADCTSACLFDHKEKSAFYHRGLVLVDLGSFGEAEKSFLYALACDPAFEPAQEALTQLQALRRTSANEF
jgi:tetratricopeptide (TPR) repeat protein